MLYVYYEEPYCVHIADSIVRPCRRVFVNSADSVVPAADDMFFVTMMLMMSEEQNERNLEILPPMR